MDRLFEIMEIFKHELKPEYRDFLDTLENIDLNANYYDYTDYHDWFYDESEEGMEACIRNVLKDFMVGGKENG